MVDSGEVCECLTDGFDTADLKAEGAALPMIISAGSTIPWASTGVLGIANSCLFGWTDHNAKL
jgi:hypothetical protein